MENKGSNVGNFTLDAGGSRAKIGNYEVGYIAIVAEALSPNQIFDLDKVTREFAKMTGLDYALYPSTNLFPSTKLYPRG
jgi:hypothetical protein